MGEPRSPPRNIAWSRNARMRCEHVLVDPEPEAGRVAGLDVTVHDAIGVARKSGPERVYLGHVRLEDQAVGDGAEKVDVGGGRDHGVARVRGAPEVPGPGHVADLPYLADAAGLGAVGLHDR